MMRTQTIELHDEAATSAAHQTALQYDHMVQAFAIRDDAELAQADAFIVKLKGRYAAEEATRKKLVGPLNDHVKMINAACFPSSKQLDATIRILTSKMAVYIDAKAQEKIAAEVSGIEAHIAGDHVAAAAALTAAQDNTTAVPSKMTVKRVWEVTIETPDAVPREYCEPDLKKLKAIAKAVDPAAQAPEIPGLVFTLVVKGSKRR